MKTYAEFDTNDICTRLVTTSDPTLEIEEHMEEITDPELAQAIRVNEYKKVGNTIVRLSDSEIQALQDAMFSFTPEKP